MCKMITQISQNINHINVVYQLKLSMEYCLVLCQNLYHAQQNKYREQNYFSPSSNRFRNLHINLIQQRIYFTANQRGNRVSVSQWLTNVTENQVKMLHVHCIHFKRPYNMTFWFWMWLKCDGCYASVKL